MATKCVPGRTHGCLITNMTTRTNTRRERSPGDSGHSSPMDAPPMSHPRQPPATDHDDADAQQARRYARQARKQHASREWDDALEAELERGWEQGRGASTQDWAQARTAVRDAWNDVERHLPDEPDGAAARAAEDAAKDDDAP